MSFNQDGPNNLGGLGLDTNYNNNRYGRGGQNESGGGYSDSRFSLNATDQRSQFPQGSHFYGAGVPGRSTSGGGPVPMNILSRGQILSNMNNTTASDFRAAPHQPFGAGGILSAVGSNYNSDFGVVDGFDQQSVLNLTRIQREEEFKIQSEDFPALGATLKANDNGDATSQPDDAYTHAHIQQRMHLQLQQQQQGGSGRTGLNGPGPIPSQLSVPTNNNLQFSQPLSGNVLHQAPSGNTPEPLLAPKDPKTFGLLGLLDVVKNQDKDLNMLALGQDLTTLGLSLNSTESLYTSFSSPFVDSASADANYSTPSCYMNHSPSFKTEHLARIQMETLFYMFYSMPRDIMQAYAAQELYKRKWRFHVELKLWFKSSDDNENNNSSNNENQQYIYFDITSWEQKAFDGSARGNLASGFLPEEETKIKSST